MIKRSKKTRLLFVALIVAMPLALFPQQQTQRQDTRQQKRQQQKPETWRDTLNIDEVVVTATRVQVSRSNVPLTVSVVGSEKIENSSESALLPVLSAQVPGLFITQRGVTGFGVATGAAGQIMVRGVGGSPNTQVLVLVDGNPQFMGVMGHPLPDAYIASDVERVEVIRGAASTLYGTNAMGGVINIITREQKEDGFRADGRLMYGSYDTRKYMANAGYRKKGFNVLASFNHDQTDGHRPSSDFLINNGFVKAGYDINDHFKVNADFSLARFKATDPGMEGHSVGDSYDITRGMGSAVMTNSFDRSSGSLRLFYNFGEHDITDGFHSTDLNWGVVAYQAFNLFTGNTVTAGVDYKKYGGFAENLLAMDGIGAVLGDTTVNELAGYIYLQQELFGKLTLNGGFRLEHNSVFGFEPVPAAGVAYRPGVNTTIKASVSKGFRSPTIRELYLFNPANPDLEPERMIDYEVSLIQKLLENRLSLELTLFRARGDNLIVTAPGLSGPRNENTGEFLNRGVEFAGGFTPTESLSFNATYSFNSMKEPILASPEQVLNLNGTWKINRFNVNLALQHVHNLYSQVAPEPVQVSYTLLNSRVSYKLNDYVTFFVKGENLTNREYSINYGYPMPGIVVFGGVSLSIGGG